MQEYNTKIELEDILAVFLEENIDECILNYYNNIGIKDDYKHIYNSDDNGGIN